MPLTTMTGGPALGLTPGAVTRKAAPLRWLSADRGDMRGGAAGFGRAPVIGPVGKMRVGVAVAAEAARICPLRSAPAV